MRLICNYKDASSLFVIGRPEKLDKGRRREAVRIEVRPPVTDGWMKLCSKSELNLQTSVGSVTCGGPLTLKQPFALAHIAVDILRDCIF